MVKKIEDLLEDEIEKGNAVLFNEENMREILKDKSKEELEGMIKDLCKAYSVDDDLMRIEAIEIIQKIIEDNKKKRYVSMYNSHRRDTWIQLDCIFDDLAGMFFNLQVNLFNFFKLSTKLNYHWEYDFPSKNNFIRKKVYHYCANCNDYNFETKSCPCGSTITPYNVSCKKWNMRTKFKCPCKDYGLCEIYQRLDPAPETCINKEKLDGD